MNLECSEENGFICGNGDCIPYYMHCNGFLDCADRTDEMECGKNIICYGNINGFIFKDVNMRFWAKYVNMRNEG